MTGTPFLHAYYRRFLHFFIDDSTNLISLYTKKTLPPETHPVSIPYKIRSNIRICLPFRMFRTVFNKLHVHSHTGIKRTYNTFSQYYYIPYIENWFSIFIHDCSYTILFTTRSAFQLQKFYGYIRTYQPSFTTQILLSFYNRRFQSLCCNSSNRIK